MQIKHSLWYKVVIGPQATSLRVNHFYHMAVTKQLANGILLWTDVIDRILSHVACAWKSVHSRAVYRDWNCFDSCEVFCYYKEGIFAIFILFGIPIKCISVCLLSQCTVKISSVNLPLSNSFCFNRKLNIQCIKCSLVLS